MKIYLYSLIFLSLMIPPSIPYAKERDAFLHARQQMVKKQLQERGIHTPRILNAFLNIPREKFVLPQWRSAAYKDGPLPIGEGQTISQPYVVAFMTEAINLKRREKVLEIGTGSGYQAAILRELTDKVYSIEIRDKLTNFAKSNLKRSGHQTVQVKTADGYFGWKEHAPFDAIMITAATNHIPPPLKEQLKIGGRLILPLGSTTYFQSLVLVTRETKERFSSKSLLDVMFVPMAGRAQEPQTPPLNNKMKPK